VLLEKIALENARYLNPFATFPAYAITNFPIIPTRQNAKLVYNKFAWRLKI
jgi:hypothetical protein